MSLKIWLPLNGNIENQGTLNTTSRLPSGYTEVEYLQSSGTQWINTNDKLTSDFKMVYSINVQNGGSGSAMPWASYASGNRYNCQFPEHTAIWFQRAGGTLYRGNLDGTILNKDLYIEESLNSVSINGKVYGTGSFTFTQNNVNVGLFNSPGSSYQSANKCRTFKWFAGNILKHCFVPCYRNSDNKPGMYDTVTGTFYTNAGTGEFSVGPAVTCSITGTNYAVSNPSGKIGSCYYGNKGYLTIPVTINTANGVTFCGWAKSSSSTQSYSNPFGYSDNSNIHTSGNTRRLEWLGSQDFYWYDGGIISNGIALGRIPSINDWFHFAISCDGAKTYCYFNGVLASTHNVDMNTIINNVYVFNTPTYSDRGNFFINDFRVYDECLSADQIKEISRGLVLHYKMCGNVQIPNNCYSNPTFDTSNSDGGWNHWTASGGSGSFAQNIDKNFIFRSGQTYSHKVVCDSSATYDYLCYQEPEFSGGYRSMCAIIKAYDGAKITENICYPTWNSRNGGVENRKWTSVNKLRDGFYLCKCEGIKQDGSNDLVGIYVKPGKTIYISECYLENNYERCSDFWTRTDIEYDGSGFKNHGTVSGNVTLSADSPRYTGSYNLSDGNYITAPGFTYINSGSISFWAKINTIASNGWLPFTGPTTGYYIMASTGGTGSFYHNSAGKETKTIYEDGKVITAPSSIGVWHHYVITNVDLTTWTKFMINNYNYNWNANMQMSDIRVYSTILDATDVAELYKLGR